MSAPAATYTGNPDTNDIDKVRFLVGDTETDDPLLRDSEITGLINMYGIGSAPAQAAEAIAAKFARKVNYKAGKSSRDAGQLREQYMKLAEDLRRRQILTCVPWAGGIDPAEQDADEADPSIVDPAFKRDQFRNPEAPRTPGEGYREPYS